MANIRYYQDANGIQHESYHAACDYYGADGPDQFAAEDAYLAELYREEIMDRMMAGIIQPAAIFVVFPDDLPF